MWNGRFNLTIALLSGMATIAVCQPASAVRTQNYTDAQFISVLNGLGYPVQLGVPITDPRVQQSIRDFQLQYRLPVDGTVNLPTQDRAADVVRALKTGLNRVVKPSPQLPLSQFYGQQTETAVRVFQQQNGLPATGIATLETRRRLDDLLSDAVPRSDETSTAPAVPRAVIPRAVIPQASIPRTPISQTPVLQTPIPQASQTSSSNDSIGLYTENQLRSILLGFGYDINPARPLSDPATVRAIRDLQSIYGLSETGQPDRQTQETLSEVVKSLRNGLRVALRGNLPITQFYDSAAAAAVRRFQSRYRLPVTGVANLQVRNLIDQTAKGTRRKG